MGGAKQERQILKRNRLLLSLSICRRLVSGLPSIPISACTQVPQLAHVEIIGPPYPWVLYPLNTVFSILFHWTKVCVKVDLWSSNPCCSRISCILLLLCKNSGRRNTKSINIEELFWPVLSPKEKKKGNLFKLIMKNKLKKILVESYLSFYKKKNRSRILLINDWNQYQNTLHKTKP